MYRFLFGPVPSRRLGMSLGIDLVPKKVCSLDCVYCEVGKTTKLTLDRKEYVKLNYVKDELVRYFDQNPDPDYITFSGSGEPTLNLYIGELLAFVKEKKPNIPTAVLTNGTLLYDKTVRAAIKSADLVLPSLDAATATVFQKINRPQSDLSITKIIQGLVDFRAEFQGTIWLEVFMLPGFNMETAELTALKNAIVKINPDRVQINTLDRPGTLQNLKSATHKQLQEVVDFWNLPNVEIIAAATVRKKSEAYRSDTETAIIETVLRRPCTVDDLTKILGLHINEVNKYLDVLEGDQRIEQVQQERGVFYQINQKNRP